MANRSSLDDVPVDKVRAWELEFRRFMETAHPDVVQTVQGGGKMSDETLNALKGAIDEFKKQVAV